MSERPWMPLYIGDYEADTKHLTCEEDGAYGRLLRKMWVEHGKLPNVESTLARICGLTVRRWRKISPPVLAFFTVVDSHLEQKRISYELGKARAVSEKRKTAGSLGGRPKNAPKTAPTSLLLVTDRGSPSVVNPLKNGHDAKAKGLHARATPQPQLQLEDSSNEESITEPIGSSNTARAREDFVLEPTSEPKPKRKIATRLAEGWQPPEAFVKAALTLGMPMARIHDEAERMRDWSRSTPDGAKIDWLAAWRNWVKRALERVAPVATGPPSAGRRYVDEEEQRNAEARAFLQKVIDGKPD